MALKMTFHETYGKLPVKTLRLIRKYNVSPADWYDIEAFMPAHTWQEINDHIISRSETGMYRPGYF